MTKQDSQYDVIIVGAGLIGRLLALQLASISMRVCLIDGVALTDHGQLQQDNRTTAISWGSSLILKQLDLWSFLMTQATPINEILISQSQTSHHIHFNSMDAQGHPMGYIVANDALRSVLRDSITENALIDVQAPARAETVLFHPHYTQVILDNGSTYKASLLIAADGRGSQVRSFMQLTPIRKSYDQTAIVTAVAHEQPHHHWAFEHFMPTGPLAFLPQGTHQSAVVWSVQNRLLPALKSLSASAFAQEILQRFSMLGSLTLTADRWYYPLDLLWHKKIIGPRSLLIGDAAHTLHPIAGQGANLGFRDSVLLTEMIATQRRLGLDWGDPLFLQRYQRQRLKDVTSLTVTTHGLVRLFTQESSLLAWIRGTGMTAVQKSRWARSYLTQHAMGIGV